MSNKQEKGEKSKSDSIDGGSSHIQNDVEEIFEENSILRPPNLVHQSFQNNGDFTYKRNNNQTRLAVIFNHKYFKNNKLFQERTGTDKDVEILMELLPKLNYKVILQNDLTKNKLMEIPVEIRYEHKKILEESDSILVIILTHGKNGNKLMAYDKEYNLNELVSKFSPELCPALCDKPKIFFVQACRGGECDDGIPIARLVTQTGNDVTDGFIEDKMEIITHPVNADNFFGFSSHESHISFRNESGSWFIQGLCSVLNSFLNANKLDTVDLTEIMQITAYGIAIQESNAEENLNYHKKKQIPATYSTLIRRFYFK